MATLARGADKFEIKVGQQTKADQGRLTIKFVEIVEDSRCPPDAQCIWAGNAKIRLAISKGKSAPTFIELNTNLDPKSKSLSGYEIELVGLTQRNPASMSMMDRPLVATISIKRSR
ncbi:MAG: hypothetical protein WBO10_03695 [Pyrinomonadaceae bacterium]